MRLLHSHLVELQRRGVLVDSFGPDNGHLSVHLDPETAPGSQRAIKDLLGVEGIRIADDGEVYQQY